MASRKKRVGRREFLKWFWPAIIAMATICLAGLMAAQQLGNCIGPGQDKVLPQSKESVPAPRPVVRLSILVDNSMARPGVAASWEFACLVEAHGHTVLFDTGADPAVLKRNLAALDADPGRIEAVVISHYHSDHTLGAPGLGTLSGVPVLIPQGFEGRQREAAALQLAGLTLVPVTEAKLLFEGIAVTAPMHFETRLPSSNPSERPIDQDWERALTIDTPEGLVVIVGCSHPGILSTLE